jgi:hypothetical protein
MGEVSNALRSGVDVLLPFELHNLLRAFFHESRTLLTLKGFACFLVEQSIRNTSLNTLKAPRKISVLVKAM